MKLSAMMAKTVKEADLDQYIKMGGFVAEHKYDGSRIVYRYGKFFTQDRFSYRDSRDVTPKFPELAHTPLEVVLDGEIVAESGSFTDTGSRIHLADKLLIRIASKKNPVVYWVFDILEVKGESVMNLPLWQRKELLKSLNFENPRFELVDATENIQEIWDKTKKEKSEGIMLKHREGVYEPTKRSSAWLKCKNFKEAIVVCKAYTENPKGIRLEMDNSQGLQCAGYNAPPVKQAIDERGSVRIEIQYLTKDEKAGGKEGEYVYRFPSYKGMVA